MSGGEEILESGFVEDLPRSKRQYERLLKFHWDFYCELAYQRSKVYEALKASLAERAGAFAFEGWQRAVKYRYSLEPLSATGSLNDPGGRFNIGKIDPTRFTAFPGLYVAFDKKTAMAELLGGDARGQSLTAEDLALTNPTSITLVSVCGEIESALDVSNENSVAGFVSLIRRFQLSPELTREARKLGFGSLRLARTSKEMVDELHNLWWRQWPMQYDVPSPSQIFGRIAADAGIEGVTYTSVLTRQPCMVIYPQNFSNSASFIELVDPAPAETVSKRIDRTTFKNFISTVER
ncbi:MAG: RES domain-containing protein [Terriglobia bacterium]